MFGSNLARERLLDMEQRLRPARRQTFALVGVVLACCAPWIGVLSLVFMLAAAAVYAVTEVLTPRFRQPATLYFAAWVLVEAILATSIAMSGQLRDYAVSLLVIPVFTLNARFSSRAIVVGVVLAVVAMLAVILTGPLGAVERDPPIVVIPVMLAVACARLTNPLMLSDIENRRGVRIDGLTRLLNRRALESRAADLAQLSAVDGGGVAMIVCDVDRFKEINDSQGHATGDAVLRQVATVLRSVSRATEMTYRLGGDEFVILLPGADLRAASSHAERLRSQVAAASFAGGLKITMSFGVAASAPGEVFDYPMVFASADGALYAAKGAGRNRVQTPAARDGSRSPAPAPLALAAPIA